VAEPGVVRKTRSDDVPRGGRFVIGSANYQRFDGIACSGRLVALDWHERGLELAYAR
jgi:hypothetical protein